MERNSEKGKNILMENESEDTDVHLPDELKSKCLEISPLRSVLRTCVLSESWAEMIDNADSSKASSSQSVTKPRILFTSYLRERKEKQKPSTTMYRWFHSILQEKPPELWIPNEVYLPRLCDDSCDYVSQMVLGLVCCYEGGNSMICIPGGEKFMALPKVDISWVDDANFFLGYDHESQIFKVLCVVTRPSRMECQVISLVDEEDKSWRKVDCEISHIPTTRGLWLHGKVYCGAYSKTNRHHFFLMCFNLKNEEFSIISVPEEPISEIRYNCITLAKINDKLALVKHYPPHDVNIWILEATTWSKLPFHILSTFSEIAGGCFYKCIGTIGTDLFIFAPQVVSKGELHIIYYDFGEQLLKKIMIGGRLPEQEACLQVFLDYIENPTLSAIETISNMTPM